MPPKAEAFVSKRLVDLRLGCDDQKKNYRSVTEKAWKIIESYDPTEKKILFEKYSALLHTFQ